MTVAEAHAYIAQALCPPEQRVRAVETLAHAFCERLPKEERAPWRPRKPELEARLRKLHGRYVRGIAVGHIAVQVGLSRWGADTTPHRAAAHTGALLPSKQQRGREEPPRGFDVLKASQPYFAAAHMLAPLALARHPKRLTIYARHPELIAPAVPTNFAGLILDDRWPRQAVQVAAMWRLVLADKI